MKRLLVFIYATLLLGPVLHAQETDTRSPPNGAASSTGTAGTGSREIEPTCARGNSNPGSNGATKA